jgi:uroporphyrinogen-III synthase
MTHVLITRPLESSQQLAEQLADLGINSTVMPLYAFTSHDPNLDFQSVWSASGRRKLAVFTSPRAVQFGVSHIPKTQMDRLEIAAIGPASCEALATSGFPVHLMSGNGYRSEDLLQLPELVNGAGTAVIFCAPGGREALSVGLRNLGWDVVRAMVYERVAAELKPAQLDALSAADDLLSIWTSISALEIARQQLPVALWSKILNAPAIVISARIQKHLQQLGASRVELSDGPGNTDLLRSISHLSGIASSPRRK